MPKLRNDCGGQTSNSRTLNKILHLFPSDLCPHTPLQLPKTYFTSSLPQVKASFSPACINIQACYSLWVSSASTARHFSIKASIFWTIAFCSSSGGMPIKYCSFYFWASLFFPFLSQIVAPLCRLKLTPFVRSLAAAPNFSAEIRGIGFYLYKTVIAAPAFFSGSKSSPKRCAMVFAIWFW